MTSISKSPSVGSVGVIYTPFEAAESVIPETGKTIVNLKYFAGPNNVPHGHGPRDSRYSRPRWLESLGVQSQ
jgi:hypothetical protein